MISTSTNALTANYPLLLSDFVQELIALHGKIDREQQYALVCKEINAHIPKMNAATEQWKEMRDMAVLVYDRWSGAGIMPYLHEYKPEDYPPPSTENPTWECKGNGIISKQCDDTFDNPYAARDTHGIKCGGEKDPNPSVGGCGRYYYTCQDNYDAKRVEHGVKYCDSYISWWPPGLSLPKRVGICGAPYRDCQFSTSRRGVHSYHPVKSTMNGKTYISGYAAKDTGFPDYGKSYHSGSTTPPSAKAGKPLVHGANGVGVDAVIPDATPNCDTCLDGSPHCPNASSHPSGSQPSASLSPSNASNTADADDPHTVQLSILSKAASIAFYVITPNDAINDVSTYLGTASGDGTSTAATTTYTFPSGVTGDYTFYATVSYNDGTYESPHPSYTVTVALPVSSPGLSTVNASTITINGEIMMDTAPGDTVTVNLAMPDDKGYAVIYWYLAAPGVSGPGSELGSTPISSGSGIETEVSYTFSMPSSPPGVYTFTAYIYPHSSASDQSVYEYTLKIYCS